MKRIIYSLVSLSSALAFGQNSILNANSPQEFREQRQVKKDNVEPLKYGFIEDKDILRSMVVWEIIDMNDKINQPFYYDDRGEGLVSENRSLYQILLDAVNSGKIKEVYQSDAFNQRMTPQDIIAATSAVSVDDFFVQQLNTGTMENAEAQKLLKYFSSIKDSKDPQYERVSLILAKYGTQISDIMAYTGSASTSTQAEEEVTTTTGKGKKKKVVKKTKQAAAPKIDPDTILVNFDGIWRKIRLNDINGNVDKSETSTENVRALKIMGMWYIDKRDTQLRYRILGISAMGPSPDSQQAVAKLKEQAVQDSWPAAQLEAAIQNEIRLNDLFWVYYKDARQVLSSNYIFNAKNSISDITFDDVLNARRFSSVIYKTDNGMGRGGSGIIDEYIPNDAEGQLEESDRIKAQILQMENDMWNY